MVLLIPSSHEEADQALTTGASEVTNLGGWGVKERELGGYRQMAWIVHSLVGKRT